MNRSGWSRSAKYVSARQTLALLAIFLLLAAVAAPASRAQEWVRFRGPNGTGISHTKGIPTEWTEDDYAWRVKLPGIGHSSPVLWGDKIFLTSGDNKSATRYVFCLNASDGKMLWTREYKSTIHKKHARNSFASSTPAVDAKRLYVSWTAPEEFTLLALDHEGHDVWSRNLGPFVSQHSGGTSPVVYDGMVIIGNEQDAEEDNGDRMGVSFLIAVDAKTGQTRWQTPRNSARVAYSTPCVFSRNGGPDELIFNSMAHGVTSLNPKTGEVNWELAALDDESPLLDKRSCSSAMATAGGLLLASCGSGGGGNYVVAIKPGSAKSKASPKMVWKIDRNAPYVPTPVTKDDLVFLWGDKGVGTCVDAATGEIYWRERIGSGFSGSPIWVNGALYCISDDGECVVVKADKKFQLLGKNALGEASRSTPTVAGGVLYLRSYSHLMALPAKK